MKKSYAPIRLVIADDHEYFREGLKQVIVKNFNDQIEIVAEAENGRDLLKEVELKKPDVVITDMKMPVMDGFEATKIISESFDFASVLAMSSFNEDALIYDMLEAGAKGYMLKTISKHDLYTAINTAYSGEMYYCNSTSRSLIKLLGPSRYNQYQKNPKIVFNEKELSFIKFLCQDLSTKEIADKMKLSTRSVEDYCKRVREKTNTRSMVGIALYAVKNDIISLDDIN